MARAINRGVGQKSPQPGWKAPQGEYRLKTLTTRCPDPWPATRWLGDPVMPDPHGSKPHMFGTSRTLVSGMERGRRPRIEPLCT